MTLLLIQIQSETNIFLSTKVIWESEKRGLISYLSAWGCWLTSLLKNTAQPEKRDIFMKNSNEIRDVLGDSRKCFRGPWAEKGKCWPGKEPIRFQDLLPLPFPLKKKNKEYYDTANDFNCAGVRQNPIVHMYDASANKCLVVWRFLISISSRLRWTSKSSKRKAN